MNKFVIQVRFIKSDRARFLSHHELMTFMERAVRRANIPIKMSEGFNPRPRISFPTALSLGVASDDEVIYLNISEWMPCQEILRRLQPQLMPGISIKSIEPVISKEPPQVEAVEYQISFDSTIESPSQEDIDSLLSKTQILLERFRKGFLKTVDVRKFIIKVQKVDDNTISFLAKYTSDGSISPAEILKALGVKEGLNGDKVIVKKTKTIFSLNGQKQI